MSKHLNKFRDNHEMNARALKRRKMASDAARMPQEIDLRPSPTCLLVTDVKGKAHRVLFERFDDGPQYC